MRPIKDCECCFCGAEFASFGPLPMCGGCTIRQYRAWLVIATRPLAPAAPRTSARKKAGGT